MTLIRLKRGSGIPTNLQQGEPAVDLNADKLFLGGGASQGYPLGCQNLPIPRRTGVGKIAGDTAATALGTLALTASRIYFIPFVMPRRMTLTALMISVTAGAAGSASIGIYGNTKVNSDDNPGSLLASVTGLDIGTNGDKSGSINLTIEPGRLYWAAVIGSSGATLRALAVGSIQATMGRPSGGTAALTHLFVAGSGSSLPSTAPTSLSNGTGSVPAIYVFE